jgi:large subunit ribosomal protein L3
MKFLIGKKLGMTTLFDEEKGALNVTLIAFTENKVAGKRTTEKHGYQALEVTTAKTTRKQALKEFRLDKDLTEEEQVEVQAFLDSKEVGSTLSVDQFVVGEKVHVTGITKAKGFQGVVKRYNFRGAPASHGRKHDMRKPGSIGATFPEHVIKGRRMAGRMGGEQMTVQNLMVAYVNPEEGILAVKGAVPGVNGRIVKVIGA